MDNPRHSIYHMRLVIMKQYESPESFCGSYPPNVIGQCYTKGQVPISAHLLILKSAKTFGSKISVLRAVLQRFCWIMQPQFFVVALIDIYRLPEQITIL